MYMYMYIRLDTINSTIVLNYKLISVWRHVSAVHSAILGQLKSRTSYLMCAQYGIPCVYM